MPNITKGSFTLNLGIMKLQGQLAEDDRQCAWELYSELTTRVAITGKPNDPDCTDFEGELLVESLNSLYSFFQEARKIMRRFPVGRIEPSNDSHLGILISRMMANVLRPFLEKWHVKFRHWWEYESNPRLSPLDRQNQFPKINDLKNDWTSVRSLMRAIQQELVSVYSLTSL